MRPEGIYHIIIVFNVCFIPKNDVQPTIFVHELLLLKISLVLVVKLVECSIIVVKLDEMAFIQ